MAQVDSPPNGNRGKVQPTGRVLRASAIRIRLDDRKAAKKQQAKRQKWQEEAWDYFDEIPEIKNLVWFLGNALSKLKLFVAIRPEDDPNAAPIPATDPESGVPPALAARAQAELDRLKGPLGGRSEIQREANMNLEVTGECYLVGRGARVVRDKEGKETGEIIPESWDIKSTREVEVKGEGDYYIHDDPFANDEGVKLDMLLDSIIRIYQRHPGASALADCNMRGVLSECELVTLLTNELKAESKSRQSAGFLTLPNELDYAPVRLGDDQQPSDDAEEAATVPFEEALMQAIVAPIEDPSAPESVYPLLIRGEGQYLGPDFVRHFSISRDTTQLIEARIEGRVQRMARGMNAPVEAMMGHQATTFANAFQINEDMYDDHLQPRVVLLCDALTVGFLVPNLLDDPGAGDPTIIEQLIVWGDPSDIINRTDPVEASTAALESGAISWEAYRNYQGFSEDDAPELVELLFRTILKTTRPDPNLVDAIVREVDPELDVPPPVAIEAANPNAQQAVAPQVSMLRLLARLLTDPARREGVLTASAKVAAARASAPSRKLAAIDAELRAKLVATADRSLARILEKAGNRLKAKGIQTNALLKSIHPSYAVAALGRDLVAAAGFHDSDLIGDDAWVSLEQQYRTWVADAETKALAAVQQIVPLATAQITEAARKQRHDLELSWTWLADQLHDLAIKRMYDPDPSAPDIGEFDPSVRVPAGLIRQALARAGGAKNIEPVHTLRAAALSVSLGSFVGTDNGTPLGGIGNGALVTELLTDEGALVEAYEWVYGPAYRAHPFEEHEALDGEVFQNFDDDVLAAGDWVGDFYFPGDHDGCACDFEATWVSPSDLAANEPDTLDTEAPVAEPTIAETGDTLFEPAAWQRTLTDEEPHEITDARWAEIRDATYRIGGQEVPEHLAQMATALQEYSDEGYEALNSIIRNEPSALGQIAEEASDTFGRDVTHREVMDRLDEAIGQSRTTEDVVVYRGLTGVTLDVGDTMTDSAFMSTSLKPEITADFGDTVIDLSVPQGTNAAYIPWNQEQEVLLGRDTTIRAVEVIHGDTTTMPGETITRIRAVLES